MLCTAWNEFWGRRARRLARAPVPVTTDRQHSVRPTGPGTQSTSAGASANGPHCHEMRSQEAAEHAVECNRHRREAEQNPLLRHRAAQSRAPTTEPKTARCAREQQQRRLQQRSTPPHRAQQPAPQARARACATGGPAPRAPACARPGAECRPLRPTRGKRSGRGAGLGPAPKSQISRPTGSIYVDHDSLRVGEGQIAAQGAVRGTFRRPEIWGGPPRAPHSTHCAIRALNASIYPASGFMRVYGTRYCPQTPHGAAELRLTPCAKAHFEAKSTSRPRAVGCDALGHHGNGPWALMPAHCPVPTPVYPHLPHSTRRADSASATWASVHVDCWCPPRVTKRP